MARLCSVILLLLLCTTACTPRPPAAASPPAQTPAAEPAPTLRPAERTPAVPPPEASEAAAIEPRVKDYFLLVDDEVFSVERAGEANLPFGALLSTREEFWPDIYAGTYWLIECYDGVTLYFCTGPEGIAGGGEKLLHEIDITPAEGEARGPDIRTDRDIRLGDSMAAVLSAYPELAGMEEPADDGAVSLRLTDEDELYYLVFFLRDDQVAEIAAGANIQ